MSLHKELFSDLATADRIRKNNEGFINNKNDMDGFYIIVQDIAAKYGDKAYDIAENYFKAKGLTYNPDILRKPGSVRRVGYVFEGMNVFNVKVEKFKPEMVKDVLWLYNREIRNISKDLFMAADDFEKYIIKGNNTAGLFVAFNEGGQRVGFIHCIAEDEGEGSIEALFFLQGRIHKPVEEALMVRAREFFTANKVNTVEAFSGKIEYPYYKMNSDMMVEAFAEKLPHIYNKMKTCRGCSL